MLLILPDANPVYQGFRISTWHKLKNPINSIH